MPYYRTCPHCGAALDPGEICADCRNEVQSKRRKTKETAPDATNIESGKVEIGLPTNISAFILAKE